MSKENRWLIIGGTILGLAIAGFVFYWIFMRPVFIKQGCASYADSPFMQSWPEAYENCLRRNGL